MVTSQAKLADALGVSKGTVSKWIKRPDWPVAKRGPWTDSAIANIKAWQLTLRVDRSGKGEDPALTQSAGAVPPTVANYAEMKRKADAIRAAGQAEEQTLKVKRLKGELIPADHADRVAVGVTRMFVQGLIELEAALPGRLPCPPADSRRAIHDMITRLRQRLVDTARIELGRVGQTLDDVEDLADPDVGDPPEET